MLKRSKISLMAFISVSLVIIILISLYPDFFVNAEEGSFSCIDSWNVSEDSFQRSDFEFSSTGISNSSNHVDYYNSCYENGFNIGGIYEPYVSTMTSNYSLVNYFSFYDNVDDFIRVGGATEDSFIVCNRNYFCVYTDVLMNSDFGADYNGCVPCFRTSGSFANTLGLFDYSDSQIIDGKTYYRYFQNQNLVSSNLPIYYYDGFDWSFSSLNDLQNMDNPIADSGSSSVFPDGSGGTPVNNLILNSPDFHFSNKTYTPPYSSVINSGDHIPNGTITFNALLNDYQTANASNFNLEFSYKLIYNVDYTNHLNNDIGPFKQTSTLLNNKKNLSIPFVSGVTTVPLTDFINDDNSYTVKFSDVFSQLNYDSYNLSSLLAQSREVTSISYNKFDLYCICQIVSNGAKSNPYNEWYNPINKKGFLVSDAITSNNYPYAILPDSQADSNPDSTNINPDPSVPGPAGSSSDSNSNSTANGNSVVVNNNPTFNNNNSNVNSNDNSTPWLIDHLFGPDTVSNGAIGDNKISDLTDTTGTNNWIEVMKQSFSFVPVGFFNQLQLFFGICLGILVVALILRIILDLL